MQNGNHWANIYRVLSWQKIVSKYILNTKTGGRNMAMFLRKKKNLWVEIWCILTHGTVSCSWKFEKGLWQKYFKYFIYHCQKCCLKMIKSVVFLDINRILFYTLLLSARCRSARKNKPDFQGWEECAGGDLQRPKTLLWKYLSRTDCGCKWSIVVLTKMSTGHSEGPSL